MKKKGTGVVAVVDDYQPSYVALLDCVRRRFAEAVQGQKSLFLTDAAGLNELYLDNLPSNRQDHNCCACRKFIEAFGGLATISEDGVISSALWSPEAAPELYKASFTAMRDCVQKSRVVSQFLSSHAIWGQPLTGEWTHISVDAPSFALHKSKLLTAGQAMAALKENFRTVAAALADVKSAVLDEAIRIFSADALPNSEKFIAPVHWLRNLQDRPKGRKGENVLWASIAAAPEGYCHPRASVVWPLLDSIAAGESFSTIKFKFSAMVSPLQYQRPQAPPTAGNIKAAEEAFEKLGMARSLERRFARLEDLRTIWRPTEVTAAKAAGGLFAHLKAKGNGSVPAIELPAVTMTWEKFSRSILETAEQLELYAPAMGRYICVTTAEHEDATPILKWDHEDERNPVAWYVYPNGSPALQWKLAGNSWVKVTGITPFPNLWPVKRPAMPQLSDGIILVLNGAVDTNSTGGNGLFPVCLKEELFSYRATVEAYSRSAQLSGREQGSACGYDLRKQACDCRLRVLSYGRWQEYRIDRWD